MAVDAARWNHNIHYHPLILRAAARSGCQRALDVGCGEGILARELRQLVPHVSAIDVDEPSIELARQAGSDVDYIVGDFLSYPFPPGSFDLVVSVAALHHMNAARALDGCANSSARVANCSWSVSRVAATPPIFRMNWPRP